MAKAKETEQQIDVELKDLQATLANIEDARPFEDLTVRPLIPISLFHLLTSTYGMATTGRGSWQGASTHPRGRRDHDQEGKMDRAWVQREVWRPLTHVIAFFLPCRTRVEVENGFVHPMIPGSVYIRPPVDACSTPARFD